MRLKSVRVGEFKSVHDSGEFETGDVTCLVGKNEAGKTAVLEALYRLRPVIDSHGTFNVTHDPVRCLPKVVHPDVAALKLQHNPRGLIEAALAVDGPRCKMSFPRGIPAASLKPGLFRRCDARCTVFRGEYPRPH